MTPKTFFKNLSQFTETPGAIKRLRELILQLAVQGKLVPQDPRDEPASVLLKKIAAEKARLVQKGKIRKSGPLPPNKPENVPFDLPEMWEWVRFGDVSVCRDGERRPLSMSQREFRTGSYDYYGASGVIDKIDDYLFDKDLLLIGEDGANLISRSTPIAFIATGKYWVNNHAHVVDGINLDLLAYLALFINAIDLKPYVTGTAQPKMTQAKMNSILVALPPQEEQRRIVARVDQLMSLCDQLEERDAQARETRQALIQSALHALTTADDPDTFQTAWCRIRDHFDPMFITPEAVAQLRQTIRQLAIMGKLVPQDPNDEPASVSLKKIAEKKTQLVRVSSIDFIEHQSGTSVPVLGQGVIGNIVTCIPPLAEQHRIVARVDQLMSLCDQLEEQLKQTETDGTRLMEAAIHHLIAA